VFWPFLVTFYFVIIFWVLLFLVKVHRAPRAFPEYKQDNIPFVLTHDTPLVFSPDTPFVLSSNMEKKELTKAETGTEAIIGVETPKAFVGVKNANQSRLKNINIANVTRDLIGAIMKMPEDEKRLLLVENSPGLQPISAQDQPQNIIKILVGWVMNMSIEDRCRLLGEVKSKQGLSRREFARKGYVTPVYFAVKGILQNGYTRNISNSGLLIETIKDLGRKFILGDPIIINFTHPQAKKEIKIRGRIVRMTRSDIAVCFNSQI